MAEGRGGWSPFGQNGAGLLEVRGAEPSGRLAECQRQGLRQIRATHPVGGMVYSEQRLYELAPGGLAGGGALVTGPGHRDAFRAGRRVRRTGAGFVGRPLGVGPAARWSRIAWLADS